MIDAGNLLAEIGIAQTVSPYSPTENIADKQQQGKYATKRKLKSTVRFHPAKTGNRKQAARNHRIKPHSYKPQRSIFFQKNQIHFSARLYIRKMLYLCTAKARVILHRNQQAVRFSNSLLTLVYLPNLHTNKTNTTSILPVSIIYNVQYHTIKRNVAC